MEASGMEKPERRHDIDWLRVLATFGVIVFHTWRMFDPMDWEVKNNQTTELIMILVLFWSQWMMPIFFTISGASIFYSLRFRSPMQFIKARVVRILIPLLTVGIFVLSPPQDYILLVTRGEIPRGFPFLEFFSRYLSQNRPMLGFPYFGYPVFHLWYLYFLFVYSLVLLPLFVYLRSAKGAAFIERLSRYFKSSWTIYLFALPLCILNSLLDPRTDLGAVTHYGGWSYMVYPFILLYGYLLVSHERFERAITAQGKNAIVLSLVTYVLFLVPVFNMGLEGFFGSFGTPTYTLFVSLRSFGMWCFIIAILYLGKKHFSYTSPTLKYTAEGSLPFYMLHQTVIVIIGFFIADWQLGIFPKWIVLTVASFVGIMAVYEFTIRRFNISRILFGLKPIKGR